MGLKKVDGQFAAISQFLVRKTTPIVALTERNQMPDIEISRVSKRNIPCPVCSTSTYSVRYADELGNAAAPVDYDFGPETQKVYQVVNCDGCGFVYTNPVPDLGAAYADTIDHVYLESIDQRRKTAANDVRLIKKLVPKGRILDVGCNIGVFLDASAAGGFQAEGVELSDWARSKASVRHKVYGETLERLDFENQYDAITLWGVIEHLQAPHEVMHQAYRALVPGGYVFVYTGDVDSILAKVMGRRWYWFMGMHLMYFSGKTLMEMLSRIGFEDFDYRIHTSYFSLGSLAVSMKRYKILTPFSWLLQRRWLRDRFVGLTIPGEMLLIARKPAS